MKGTSTSVEKHTKLVGINKIHSCSVDGNGPIEYVEIASRRDSFMRGHDAMKRNWWIPDDFPSSAVLEAYETPAVDRSKECPKWGKPNVDLLRAFCYDNFHWQHTQTDELIQPVLTFWKTFDRPQSYRRFLFELGQRHCIHSAVCKISFGAHPKFNC